MKNIILSISILLPLLMSCNGDDKLSDAYGNFEANDIIIYSESNGVIKKLFKNEGEEITDEEIIAKIDTIQLGIKYNQAQAQCNVAKTNIGNLEKQKEVIQEQIRVLNIEVNRLEKLLKSDGATQKQYDDIKGQISVLEKKAESIDSQKKSAMAEIIVLENNTKLIHEQLTRCTITSPIKGVVLETYANEHELTMPGKALCKIANLDTIILRVYVSGDQLSKIKTGQHVVIKSDKNKKEFNKYDGVITWISNQAEFTPKIIQTKEERVNLVYAVKINVPNDGFLKIGMPGEMVIQ